MGKLWKSVGTFASLLGCLIANLITCLPNYSQQSLPSPHRRTSPFSTPQSPTVVIRPIDQLRGCESPEGQDYWESFRAQLQKVESASDFRSYLQIFRRCMTRKQEDFGNPRYFRQNPSDPLGCLDRILQLGRLSSNIDGSPKGENGQDIFPPFQNPVKENQIEEIPNDKNQASDPQNPQPIDAIENAFNQVIRAEVENAPGDASPTQFFWNLFDGDLEERKAHIESFSNKLVTAINQSYSSNAAQLPATNQWQAWQFNTDKGIEGARPVHTSHMLLSLESPAGEQYHINFNRPDFDENNPISTQASIALMRIHEGQVNYSLITDRLRLTQSAHHRKNVGFSVRCLECHIDGGFYPLFNDGEGIGLSSGATLPISTSPSTVNSELNSDANAESNNVSAMTFNQAHDSMKHAQMTTAFTPAENAFEEFDLPPFGIEPSSKMLKYCVDNFLNNPQSPRQITAAELDRFTQAVNCTRCHASDSKNFPIYNQLIGLARPLPEFAMRGEEDPLLDGGDQRNFLTTIENHLHHNHMPPKLDLNDHEKSAVLNCLKATYYGPMAQFNHIEGAQAIPPESGALIENLTALSCQEKSPQ